MIVLKLASLVVVGALFAAMGIRNLRNQHWKERVPALELLIDRAAGVDPPPRTKWDRRFARLNGWSTLIFGLFFSLIGLIGLLANIL